MTTTTRRHLVGLGATVLALGLSVAVGALALASAEGVVHLSGSSYRTEFVAPWLWYAAAAAVVPVVVAAWQSAWWLVPGVSAAAVPQFVVAAEVVRRYRESGWGDGLEVFSYLVPLGLTVLCVVAGLVAAVFGAGRRR